MHTDVRVKTTFLKKLKKKKKYPSLFLGEDLAAAVQEKEPTFLPLSSRVNSKERLLLSLVHSIVCHGINIWSEKAAEGDSLFPFFFLIFSFFLIPFLSKKEHHKNTRVPLLINLFSKLTWLSSRITFYFFHFLLKQEHFQLKQCKYIW